jgi:hypothetical protein
MPSVRILLAAAATLAALVAAGSAAAAQPPRDCVTAWNSSATPAQRHELLRAARVQVGRTPDGSRCAVTYVRSGRIGLLVAAPSAWASARPWLVFGGRPVCVPNVRVLRGGTLLPL